MHQFRVRAHCVSRPSSSTRIKSARRNRLNRPDTTNVVRPAIASRSANTISFSVRASTDAVGSSRIRIGGCSNNARASASRWRWPPDKSTPDSPSTVSYPCGSAVMNSCADAIRAARSICSIVACGCPNAMFADTVFENKKLS